MNVDRLRHRYRNLSSLLPFFVTHRHTAFLIFPDAPCKLSILKVLPCSSLRPLKDWVATEESFTESLPFLHYELPHINDCWKTIFPYFSFFFILKVLQHIHLCIFESTTKILETSQRIEANFHHFPPRLRCMRPFVVMWPVWSSWSKAAHKWIRRWQLW